MPATFKYTWGGKRIPKTLTAPKPKPPRPKPVTTYAWGGVPVTHSAFGTFTGGTPAQKKGLAKVSAAAHPAPPKPPPDYRDADYWTGIADITRKRTDALGDLDQNDTYANRDYTDALNRIATQRQQSLLNAKRGANSKGLFYSTYLTNQNKDINTGYDDQQGAAGRALRGILDTDATKRRAVNEQYGTGDGKDYGTAGAQLIQDAILRAITGQAAAPQVASGKPGGGTNTNTLALLLSLLGGGS